MDAPSQAPAPAPATPPSRAFARHLLAFVLVNAGLTGVNVFTGPPWWAFWPLAAWGVALTLHFLVHRAATIDDAWVETRTQELRDRSYDQGHIDNIRDTPAPSIQEQVESPRRDGPA